MKILREIAAAIDATVEGDAQMIIQRVRPLESAGQGDLSFLVKGKSPPERELIQAAAIIVSRELSAELFPSSTALLRADEPYLAFARALDFFFPAPVHPFRGIAAGALMEPGVETGKDAAIAAGATICRGARLGDRVVIYPGVFIGPNSSIGDDSVLYANVVVYENCLIGRRCILHAGAVIGADGFGFVPTPKGVKKILHVGRVRIEDDVEVGANTTIDRGMLDDTVIGRGTKLDNLVQIGHNCVLGEGCMLAAQVGLAGSTRVGKHVLLGGQVGVSGHVSLGDGCQVGAQSGVNNDIPAGERYMGSPADKLSKTARNYAAFSRLPELRKELFELKGAVARLEGALRKPPAADPAANFAAEDLGGPRGI